MKNVFSITFLLFASICFAQKDSIKPTKHTPLPPDTINGKIVEHPETMPEFPGGKAAMNQFLAQNIHYPPDERDNGLQGIVVVNFTVSYEGTITDIVLVKEVKGAPGLGKEAIRVVKKMPKWIPGTQDGKPVDVKFHVPVTFRIN